MKRIRILSHEQARQALHFASDGLLDMTLQPALEKHLSGCPDCRRYAQGLAVLEINLSTQLKAAWKASPPSEPQVASLLKKLRQRTRNNPMKKAFLDAARTIAYGLAGILLIAAFAWSIRTLLPQASPAAQITLPVQETEATVVETTGTSNPPTETALPTASPSRQPQTQPPSGTASLFPSTVFDFVGGFPDAQTAVNLYRLQLPEAVSPDSARQMAARLGVRGGVYEMQSEGFDQTLYEVTDGFSLVRFINFAEQFVYETGYADPIRSGGEPLSFEQQFTIASDFLNTFGLPNQPYQAEPSAIEQGVVIFTPLVEGRPVIYGNGQNPGNLEWISVQVNAAGQVTRVMYSQQNFTPLGEYPILSAVQAWERLSQPNAIQHAQFAVLAADQPNTYRLWSRPFPVGQTVDIYGYIQVRQPVDPNDPILISLNNTLVSGGDSLASVDSGTYIHAWGQFTEAENGNLVFNLENWETSPWVEEYYQGAIQRQDGQGRLVTDNGAFILPELPADIPDGYQVYVTGILQPGDPATLDWFTITGGEYPSSYYTSSSCGGGGGGGGGGAENANFGGGGFASLNLEQNQLETPTPEPGPYAIGDRIDDLSGRVQATNNLYSDGSSVLEIYWQSDPTEAAPYGYYFRLDGTAMAGIEQYQNLPVLVWGQITNEINDVLVITVEGYEPEYAGMTIQQWIGTESIVTLDGQDVVLLTSSNFESFVLQSSLTWGAEGNLIGVLGDLIEIEGYIIPDQRFGGYPVIQDLSGGMPPDNEVTSDDIYVVDHSYETPDVNTLMAGQVTIDSVELAYASISLETCLSRHASDPNMIPYLTVQPVWVFTGHFEDGRIIVIQVQALPDEYLQ